MALVLSGPLWLLTTVLATWWVREPMVVLVVEALSERTFVFTYCVATFLLITAVVSRERFWPEKAPTASSIAGRKLVFLASPVLQLLLLSHVWFVFVVGDVLGALVVGGVHVVVLLCLVVSAWRTRGVDCIALATLLLLGYVGALVPYARYYLEQMA